LPVFIVINFSIHNIHNFYLPSDISSFDYLDFLIILFTELISEI